MQAQQFPALTGQWFFDNLGKDIPQKILKAPDGNLLIGGTTWLEEQSAEDCSNIFILKTSPQGVLIWERDIAIDGCQELYDMLLTPEGELLFTGRSNSLISHEESGDDTYWGDFLAGKLNRYGQVEWLKSYGGSQLDFGYAIAANRLYRDEYILAGGTHSADGAISAPQGMSDALILGINGQGEKRFGLNVGGEENDWIHAAAACRNGDYLLAGYSNSRSLSTQPLGDYGNGLLLRITPGGRLLWRRVVPCPEGGFFSAVLETEFEHVLLAGNQVVQGEKQQFWWMILDERGERIMEQLAPGPNDERVEAATNCTKGGFLLGGYGKSRGQNGPYAKGGDDFWLLRLDATGNVLWRNTYGGPGDERCHDVIEYEPGVFYAVGEKVNDFQKPQSGNTDFWLIRIEELPCEKLSADIFVRADKYKALHNKPLRFRARHNYGDRFSWDFGDGTSSGEEQPLKTYTRPGLYPVSLTVFANENCQQTVRLKKKLKVY